MRSQYRFIIAILALLFGMGCGITNQITNAFEKVDVKIVSPQADIRITEAIPEGNTAYLELRVTYDGTKESNIAQVTVNGENMGICSLKRGENLCGTFGLKQTGPQNITVQVMKNNGEVVTTETNFTWQPYSQTESFIKFISGEAGNGFLVVIVIAIAVILLLTIRMLRSVNVWAFALLALVVVALVFLAPSMFGGVEALISIKALQTFLIKVVGAVVTVIVIVAAMRYGYSIKFPTYTQVRAQGEKGMFEGSHVGMGEIGTGNSKNETVNALFRTAEDVAHGPSLIDQIARPLIGDGIKHETIDRPGLISSIFSFGRKKAKK